MPLDEYALIQLGLRIGAAILLFLVGRWLARRTRNTLRATLVKTTLAPSMTRLLLLAVYYGILFLTVVLALAVAGVPVATVLNASLVIVVILGIALQQSISNLAATIVFMLFQPFKVGELIEANGVMGTVTEIQLFSTVLVTGDNKVITIPNGQIQGNNLVNYTRQGRLRVDFTFDVSYGDDLPKVKRLLAEILAADKRVLAEPALMIFVQALGENGVSIAVRPWVTPDDYWSLQWDIPERVRLRFAAEGVTIPLPQRVVHVDGRGATELVETLMRPPGHHTLQKDGGERS